MNDAVPPYATAFPALNAANVVPAAPDIRARWEPTLQKWGGTMRGAVEDLAEMLAVGLGLARGTFRDAGRYGPHLLAPTASDLRLHGAPDTILAGFHTDLNFLTIHGRSRFPGLHVWARNAGRRVAVRFPPRADTGAVLLVQAGKQLEHASGGLVRAGFHEVVVNGATRAAMAARVRDAPERPLIRISSTFFWHLSSDHDLAPIPALAARARELRADARARGVEEEEVVYEPMKVGAQVQK
jgi:isopenicillin N synthase-like dioxygenase